MPPHPAQASLTIVCLYGWDYMHSGAVAQRGQSVASLGSRAVGAAGSLATEPSFQPMVDWYSPPQALSQMTPPQRSHPGFLTAIILFPRKCFGVYLFGFLFVPLSWLS